MTNQFADDGIVFSGQAPFITDDGSSSVNPTISGSPLFQGTIVGTFVKPGTDIPATVNKFSLSVGYIDNPSSTQMTVYNSKGKQLGVLVATQEGFNQLYSTFPDAASFSVSSVANEPSGWEINTIQVGPVNADYIAMGDSYSSGEGTYDFPWSQAQGTQCDTGPLAWPVQMAAAVDNGSADPDDALNINQNTLVACQGEQSDQLGSPRTDVGQTVSELDQVTTLVQKGPPDLVTITIGGNDLGFASILKTCFIGGAEVCLAAADVLDYKVTVGADNFISQLTTAYREVKSAADGGDENDGNGPQVAVVGYPDLFPQPGGIGTAFSVTYRCPWLRESLFPYDEFPVSPYLNVLLSTLANAQASINDDMAVAALAAGVEFVPIPDSLAGHELCTGTPYINPLTLTGGLSGDRNLGHPNVAGSAAIASAVSSGLGLGQSGGGGGGGETPVASRPPAQTHPVTGVIHPGRRLGDSGPLSFSGGPLLAGTTGADYIDYLVATGGQGAETWAITSGSLPPGLSLDPDTGTITGTPTAAGDDTFTAQVTDSSDPPQTASAQVTIDVSDPPALNVITTSPADATATQPYTFGLQASGGLGALTWTITSGALPSGLHLDAATGEITGTPAATATGTGTSSFTVQAADSSSPAQTATEDESITVHPTSDPLTITTTSLPEIAAGQDYGGQLTSTGGMAPVTWAVSAGSLPPGLSLDPGTGALSGTPTQAGTYDFTVQATDGTPSSPQTAATQLSITVDAAPALSVTTTGAFDGTEGSYYSSTFQATGGAGSYAWSIGSGSLPAGLSLDPDTGQVTGIPTATGNFSFGVTVTDAAGNTATQSYSISIAQVPLTVSPTLPPATAGSYYTANVTPSGGQAPYSWNLVSGKLPPGLTFDASTGTITGTPRYNGSFPLQIGVADSSSPSQQVTASITLKVTVKPKLTLSSRAPVSGTVGDFYTTGIGYSGGKGPYTWTVTSGSLPPGLSLDPGSGMVTGTPSAAGTYPVTIQVTDSSIPTTESATTSITFTIASSAKLTVTPGPLPLATQGASYEATLQASGGVPPYTWSLSGALPAGLYLDPEGEIYGTPTGHPVKNITVKVTDSAATPSTATRFYKFTVSPGAPLSIDTTSLDNATQGSSYEEPLTASGGAGYYTWSLAPKQGRLPAGLYLDSGGEIYGTPQQFGVNTFTVRVTDEATPIAHTTKEVLSIDVEAVPAAEPPAIGRPVSGARSHVLMLRVPITGLS